MTKENKQETDYYANVESYYDEDATLGFESRANINSSLERIRSDFRDITIQYDFNNVLEIGCGPGFDIHWFAAKYPEKSFTAVDISGEMVNLTRNRLEKNSIKNVTLFRSDERSLVEKLGKNTFDLIYVYFGALNTVNDLNETAGHINKLLKTNGIAVLTFVNKWYLRELLVQLIKLNLKTAFARLGNTWGGYSVTRHLPSHCYSAGKIRQAFSGFKLISKKGYSIFYPPWYNDHKVREKPSKAERLWNLDQKIQNTPLWSKGEYTLFVFQK